MSKNKSCRLAFPIRIDRYSISPVNSDGSPVSRENRRFPASENRRLLICAFFQGIERLTQSASFEVAPFLTAGDQRAENKGNYHHPTHQRGIFGNTAETQKRNPSLTQRVVICTNTQLQNFNASLQRRPALWWESRQTLINCRPVPDDFDRHPGGC